MPGTPTESVTIAFTPVNQRGKYSPRNVGAVWIQDVSGQYVKTVAVWGTVELQSLKTWAATGHSDCPPSGVFGVASCPDAVTGATSVTYVAHTATWQMNDASGAIVPDGPYDVFIEVTDQHTSTQVTSVSITKGPDPQNSNPPDAMYFTGISVTYP
jgi:hypothetical protein